MRDSKAYTIDDWQHKTLVAFRSVQYYIATPTGSIWKDPIFLSQNNKKDDFSSTVLRQLYSSGADILYGMLFRQILFDFHPQIAPPESKQEEIKPSENTKTFVVHSRHFRTADTGTKALAEFACLEQLLGDFHKKEQHRQTQQQHQHQEQCIVYLMSDRETTIGILQSHIRQKYHCQPVVATHSSISATAGHYQEHGKWAGAGFIQDLMLGSQARDGFIGHCYRSSSQLLRELVEYNRHMDGILEELPTCCLPSV